jgi:hypothetical protein
MGVPRKWQKKLHKLDANHRWKAKDGYQIFVADGGALRFDIPSGWVVIPGDTSFKFHDRQPPDDECVVEVTLNYLPPADFSEFPLATALADVLRDSYESATSRGEVMTEQRGDTRLAWAEIRYVDDSLLRPAIAHTLLGLRGVIQILLTMAYWTDDAERFTPVWEEILRSIRLGEAVDRSGRRQPPIVPRGYG